MKHSKDLFERRRRRVRIKLRKIGDRPRLSVFRSSKHIYAQVIDDERGVTVAAASSLEARAGGKTAADRAAAAEIGRLVAERAKEAGISKVVFDRGGYLYHGRLRALADAAREAGLEF